MEIKEIVSKQIAKTKNLLEATEIQHGEIIYNNTYCQLLSQSAKQFDFIISTDENIDAIEVALKFDEENIIPFVNNKANGWSRYSYACLKQINYELNLFEPKDQIEHKQYTREGMIQRVLNERSQKAEKAQYHILWASNIFGDHILTNDKGLKYKIFLRDFENETGYSDSMDSIINKLGTTKHIMYAFKKLKEDKSLLNKLDKTYPFTEIYLDPLNDYKITWHYPHKLPLEIQLLISKYFGKSKYIENDKTRAFLDFIKEAEQFKAVVIRPEVIEKVENTFENAVLEDLRENTVHDFKLIKADLFDYQKEGISFATFRKACIIADEMGLGKTIQAIGTALIKKETFGFQHTLVVCPASLKEQWKKEIERFSNEKAEIIQGPPEERELQYVQSECYFLIINYETVLRDQIAINNSDIDFLILDEAQRVKNYATQTAHAIKNINRKHVLVITGTPIENRLIDLFSIVSILDPNFLGPLWEFSYQYCLFDPDRYNKINGYYNLQELKKRMEPILLRREKRNVLDQLPNVQQINIPVMLSPLQSDYHGACARGIAAILKKKFITPYDMQRMQLLLANMRMVCNSTFLIDGETNESPKLEELKYILLEKLDIKNSNKKIIIFSEWVKMHKLIGSVLRENNIGFAELNGNVPVKLRGNLIRKFESDDSCKVFLSTEAGGSGLNLQVADTLINFELPWNPAKKNQRIGRIDRLGQKSKKLIIFNFISRYSIEEKIAAGLVVKQNLFEGVLDKSSTTNFVDFSAKGRSQFLQQLESIISGLEDISPEKEIKQEMEKSVEEPVNMVSDNEKIGEIDLSGDTNGSHEVIDSSKNALVEKSNNSEKETINPVEFEKIMENGLQFLSGLVKLSTGKDIGLEGQKINIDKETGEITMKFKLPV